LTDVRKLLELFVASGRGSKELGVFFGLLSLVQKKSPRDEPWAFNLVGQKGVIGMFFLLLSIPKGYHLRVKFLKDGQIEVTLEPPELI